MVTGFAVRKLNKAIAATVGLLFLAVNVLGIARMMEIDLTIPQLNALIDATLLGNLVLFRRANPYWLMPGIVVSTDKLTQIEYEAMLDLEVSDLVLVSISRDPSDERNGVEWCIEGWTEQWDTDGHTIQFALSDRQRFGLTGIRTVAELALLTVTQAAALDIRDAMFKEIT